MSTLLSEFVQPITTAVIPATDGRKCIGEARGVFCHIDPHFENWGLNVTSKAHPKQQVCTGQLVKDGRFDQFFSSLIEGKEIDRLCLTQSQIVSFCRKHKQLLNQDDLATFFLFKNKEEYFVADVDVWLTGLAIYVYPFSYEYVWNGVLGHRVVVPQLED